MRNLYNLFIRLYGFSITLASFLGNKKAKLWVSGRAEWLKKLQENVPKEKKVIWFHCASLGEFEQARPLIESVKAKCTNHFILLSFFSPSGHQAVINKFKLADHICYLPLDTPKNARRFIEISNVHLAIFTKYEFWYNHLNQLKKKNVPTILVSAIFRQNQNFFQFYGKWFLKHLKAYKRIFVQEEASFKILNSAGLFNVELAGDTRFDRVKDIKSSNQEISALTHINTNTLLLGSSWEQEQMFAAQLSEEVENIKIIIAPHEIDKQKINSLKLDFKRKTVLWSEIDNSEILDFEILIIDSIGALSSLYRYCDIALIGGGFGKGIHNVLEAAVYGKPVLFGPHYHKFKEAKDLINEGGAFEINSYSSFKAIIEKLTSDNEYYSIASNAASDYVKNNSGATKKIIQYIEKESLLG